MDATATLGTWKRYLWHTIAFGVLVGCVYLLPPLAFVVAFTLSLIVCPAFSDGDIWYALALPLAPAIGFFASGGDAYFSVLLTMFPYLCLLVVAAKQRWRMTFLMEILLCTGAFLLSALGMLIRLSELLGGPLFQSLSQYVVDWIQGSPLSGNILYQLTQFGFLTVPDAYRDTAAFQLGSFVLLNPPLQKELLNMLRLRLNEGFAQWIPSILMQGSIILGLFTALTTERARSRKATVPLPIPSFTLLRLSRREQRFMLALCIGIVLTSFSDNAVTSLVCALMYAAFVSVYQLLGAAIMVFTFSRRHPERAVLYGILAALIYLIFPVALFLLGVVDQFIKFRTSGIQPKDQDQEEE